MKEKRSAGLLLFRETGEGPQVLLGHMGGPFWARKDAAAWSVPKGEYGPEETAFDAARREFGEEVGLPPPEGPYIPLGETRQAAGKTVTVWAVAGDLDPADAVPGTFTMEWPRGSGRTREFPELDRVAWFTPAEGRRALVAAQTVFLDRLAAHLGSDDG
ncbi:NUDIX domain-containing protein [Streptomyces tsukubensis]|uniref:Nudix hydrolase domain-containing protein n=1 Tax=Streptomyces tsukubensis TaxID=83656 RepID=A0A1V4A033_9ACTN|nr:NUDIX domain-containing protein [Streptomyces tsukubensis]OON72189.1 hypothetical protein B1H18_30815 [Streptomyces tsukubensis]QFR97076.1 NUDIX domain-containing protein [Streptomyces tsukubensis]